VGQNTTILLYGGSQVNDNMFRPLLIRPSSGQTYLRGVLQNSCSFI